MYVYCFFLQKIEDLPTPRVQKRLESLVPDLRSLTQSAHSYSGISDRKAALLMACRKFLKFCNLTKAVDPSSK